MFNKIKKAIEAYKKQSTETIYVGKEFNDKMDALGYGVKELKYDPPKESTKEILKDLRYTESKTLREVMEEDMENALKKAADNGDVRYKKPKESPKASKELVEDTINSTEIYREAKQRILKAQHKQVAYGLDKYPKPLSADVWDIYETIDHIIDENVDQLHYLVMLQIHLKRLLDGPKMISTGGFDKLKKEEVIAAIEENWGIAEPGIIYADGVPYKVNKSGEWETYNKDVKISSVKIPHWGYTTDEFVKDASNCGADMDGDKVNMNFDDFPKFDPPKKKYSITPDIFEPRKFTVDLWVDRDDTIDDVLTSLKKALENTDWSVD